MRLLLVSLLSCTGEEERGREGEREEGEEGGKERKARGNTQVERGRRGGRKGGKGGREEGRKGGREGDETPSPVVAEREVCGSRWPAPSARCLG